MLRRRAVTQRRTHRLNAGLHAAGACAVVTLTPPSFHQRESTRRHNHVRGWRVGQSSLPPAQPIRQQHSFDSRARVHRLVKARARMRAAACSVGGASTALRKEAGRNVRLTERLVDIRREILQLLLHQQLLKKSTKTSGCVCVNEVCVRRTRTNKTRRCVRASTGLSR